MRVVLCPWVEDALDDAKFSKMFMNNFFTSSRIKFHFLCGNCTDDLKFFSLKVNFEFSSIKSSTNFCLHVNSLHQKFFQMLSSEEFSSIVLNYVMTFYSFLIFWIYVKNGSDDDDDLEPHSTHILQTQKPRCLCHFLDVSFASISQSVKMFRGLKTN